MLKKLAACALLAGTATTYAAPTPLSLVLNDPVVQCRADGRGADVHLSWSVITGRADAADQSGQLDGAGITLPAIAAGNVTDGGGWTFAGNIKSADGAYDTLLANGSHTFELCVAQNGPQGEVCQTQTIVVNCTSTEPCANASPKGEIPANQNLCKANGRINVQFEGNFGDPALLTITGPNGFVLVPNVDRAGDSCQYHYNWDPNGNNGGAGTYAFQVEGNGQDPLEFSATLNCN